MDEDSGKGEWQGFVFERSRVKGLHRMVWHVTFCGALTVALCPRCYKLSGMEKALTRSACWLACICMSKVRGLQLASPIHMVPRELTHTLSCISLTMLHIYIIVHPFV